MHGELALRPQPASGKGRGNGLRGLRAVRFRVIYRAHTPRVIEIVPIGARERLYEETLRLVSAECRQSIGVILQPYEWFVWRKS